MTDPATTATDADRQEQLADVVPAGPELAGEITAPGDDVPDADAVEQQLSAVRSAGLGAPGADAEADEADLLEQQVAVPVDEDDVRD